MSDISYWDSYFIKQVIAICKEHQNHTFMFLTKSPLVYLDYTWPLNTMQGTTITGTETALYQKIAANVLKNVHSPFISFEPLTPNVSIKQFITPALKLCAIGMQTGAQHEVDIHGVYNSIITIPKDFRQDPKKSIVKQPLSRYLLRKKLDWRNADEV